jgi:hypothetical protein
MEVSVEFGWAEEMDPEESGGVVGEFCDGESAADSYG